MPYTIKIDVFMNGVPPFAIVDQAVHKNEGTGTAGALLFRRPGNQEACCAVLGVSAYKPWCNVVTGLSSSDTASDVLDTFYGSGFRVKGWVQLVEEKKTTSGKISVHAQFLKVEKDLLHAEVHITS
ncbi:hypothetical protein FRB95_013727 [Tulasnella sp. JGI-2019a]|nr:hypothetical protein FRB95_013727 [Tulasnella sp. JGI-2019a]